MGGKLAERLAEQRRAGSSYADIARWLHKEHDVEVTAEGVRKWCLQLGIAERIQDGAA